MSAPASTEAQGQVRVRVWDLPTRLFHWGIVAAVGMAWWSITVHDLTIHRTAGAVAAGLLAFRFWWGLFGGSTARFSDFLRGPGAVARYARGLFGKGEDHALGHNPMGGWSVAALILALSLIVGFGLFAVDTDGLESGPLASLVSFEQGRAASHWHDLAFDALKALVVLHLIAIAFYALVKRDNLVRPMVLGGRMAPAGTKGLQPARLWALASGLVLGAGVAILLIRMNG